MKGHEKMNEKTMFHYNILDNYVNSIICISVCKQAAA